ncbi:MAG: hypothetical protein AAB215_04380 [Planctomycetota bacterium]
MLPKLNRRCPACGRESEFDSAYIGCLRPCPFCGKGVPIAEAPDGTVVIPQSPLDRCRCGKEREPVWRGCFFAIVSVRKERESYGVLALFGFLFGLLGHLIVASLRREEPTVLSWYGWTCESCEGRVRWARRFFVLRWFVLPLAFLSGFLIYAVILLLRTGALNLAADFEETLGYGLLLSIPSLVLLFLFQRIGLWAAARPLRASLKAGRVTKFFVYRSLEDLPG